MVRKIVVTLDHRTVADLDRALQSASGLLSERERRSRLARELAKLDPGEEKRLADEGFGAKSWPEY